MLTFCMIVHQETSKHSLGNDSESNRIILLFICYCWQAFSMRLLCQFCIKIISLTQSLPSLVAGKPSSAMSLRITLQSRRQKAEISSRFLSVVLRGNPFSSLAIPFFPICGRLYRSLKMMGLPQLQMHPLRGMPPLSRPKLFAASLA